MAPRPSGFVASSAKPSIAADACAQKKSVAARDREPKRLRSRPRRTDEILDLQEGITIQRVVHPPAGTAVGHQTCILQCLEVMGQQRLARFQRILQLADTPLSTRQQRKDAQPLLIRDRFEPREQQINVVFRCRIHDPIIHQC